VTRVSRDARHARETGSYAGAYERPISDRHVVFFVVCDRGDWPEKLGE
jgi:hypothetical protein